VSGIGRAHRFPTLRDTAAWGRQERRKRLLLVAAVAVALLVGFALGGCNGAHGRC